MKERPFTRQLGETFAFQCPSTCTFFGVRAKGNFRVHVDSCLTGLTLGGVRSFIECVFGLRESDESSTSQRTHRLESYMWGHWTKEGFCYEVGGRRVCETTVAYLLGYIDNEEFCLGSCGGGWKAAKKRVKDARIQGVDLVQLQNEDLKLHTSASG